MFRQQNQTGCDRRYEHNSSRFFMGALFFLGLQKARRQKYGTDKTESLRGKMLRKYIREIYQGVEKDGR
jgi:hypothetical protein